MFFCTCNFLKGKVTLSDRREKFYNDLWDSGWNNSSRMNFTVPVVLGCIVNCALVTRRKLFLFWRPDVSLFKDWKSLKQHQRSNKQRISHDRQHLSFILHFFLTYFFHILLLCTAIHFYFFPQCPVLIPVSALFYLYFSFFVAFHPLSIQTKSQSLIRPREAPIWPLISLSDLQ